MTFVHGKAGRVFCNEYQQSAYIKGWTVTGERATAEVTVLTTTGGTNFIPGLRSGSLSLEALFDSTATALDEEFAAATGTDNGALWTVCPDGTTLGSPAFVAVTDPTGHSVESSTSEAVSLSLEAQADDGVDRGRIVHALGAETADANGTSIDDTAASANGGVAVLHVTAYSGLTSAALKVQHSANNSTWADLATFATVTALTAERVTVSGTVNRYLRVVTDVTGTGSVTFLASFARR